MPGKGVALVTDAGQGIGRTIALRLADDGFDIAVNGVVVGELESLVEQIKSKGRQSSIHIADVSMEDSVKKMVEDVVKEHGGLDVMVVNAGIGRIETILDCNGLSPPTPPLIAAESFDTSTEDWDKLFAVIAKGTFLCYKHAAQQMIKQGRGGRIIGASLLSGKQRSTNISVYCRIKFTIRGFTRAAAQAAEFSQYGITVNAYAPGAIEIPHLHDSVCTSEDAVKVGDGEGVLTAARRNGLPTEAASLVSYLASHDSHSITGQTIPCDDNVVTSDLA